MNSILLERRSARFVIVGIAALFCIAWLFGPELVLDAANVAGRPSRIERFSIHFWEVFSFTTVNCVVLYMLVSKVAAAPSRLSFLPQLAEAASAGLAFADAEGQITYANTVFLRLFGLNAGMVGQVGIAELLAARADSASGPVLPVSHRSEYTLNRDTGQGHVARISLVVDSIADGAEGYLLEATDVSEAYGIGHRAALTGGAIDNLAHSVVVCDASLPGWPILLANAATERLTLFTPTELIGAQWLLLQGYEIEPDGLSTIRQAIARREAASADLRSLRKDGTSFTMRLHATPMASDTGLANLVVFLQRDVTEELDERTVEQQALYHDAVSSLLTRAGFMRALAAMSGGSPTRSCLCLRADIRNFHEFNVAAGWEAGDALLAQLGHRLAASLPEAVIGRVAGDEFAIAMLVEPEEVAAWVDVVRQVADGRYVTPRASYDPEVAIGYTLAPPGTGQRAIMQQSAIALKEAIRNGTGDACRFDQAMESRISKRRQLTSELQEAVASRQFGIEFMPEVALSDGRIVAAEALVRWYHPLFGKQEPSGFIGLARQSGLIREIGAIVLSKAAEFSAVHSNSADRAVVIAINLSMAELRRHDFADDVERTLDRLGAPAGCLQLDVAEDVLAMASTDIIRTLKRLRARGVRLAIDDFGAGHSPLRFADRCVVDKIKVAPVFTASLESDGPNRSVFKAILDVGAAHGAQIVAEGVETETQRQELLRLGCALGQGFLFTRPLRAEVLHDLLTSGAKLPLPAR